MLKEKSEIKKTALNIKQLIISSMISIAFLFSIVGIAILNNSKDIETIIGSTILFAIMTVIFYFVLPLAAKSNIITSRQKVSKKELLIWFIVLVLMFSVYWLAFYPASMSYDSVVQWKQATFNRYDDWYPIMHTIIFMKLPMLIWNSPASSALLQILFGSAILTYMIASLRKIGLNKIAVFIIVLLITLNYGNGKMIQTLWKDVPYSYLILLLTVININIYYSKGKWLEKLKNELLYSITLLLIMFMRHNGIIIVILSCLVTGLLYKEYLRNVIIIMLIAIFVKEATNNIAFEDIGILKHIAPFSEMLGVPMNIIATTINEGGNINNEQKTYIYSLIPENKWKEFYIPGNFNNIKWNTEYYMQVENDKYKYIKTFSEIVIKNPKLAVKGYLYTIEPIFSFENGYPGLANISKGSGYNSNIINKNLKNEKISEMIKKDDKNSFNEYLEFIYPNVGISTFYILIALAIILMKKQYKKLIVFVPVISNTLVIMLLITGGEMRFVYSSILCYIPIAIITFMDNNEENEIAKL